MPDDAVADLRGQPHERRPQRRDPDRNLLAHRRLGQLELAEVRPVVLALERGQTRVGSGDDVTNRGHGLPQVRERLVLRRAEDAPRPGEHAGAEAENESTSRDAIEIHRGHRGLERAARRGDRDAAGELDPLGGRSRGRQREEGRAVHLRCEEALHAPLFGLLRQGDQNRRRHRPHESPVSTLGPALG